jgi:dienelactone hydrolase
MAANQACVELDAGIGEGPMCCHRVIFFMLVSAAFCFPSEGLPLWGDLKPGPYGVGFALRSRYDYSRAFRPEVRFDGKRSTGETARPVQILVWYPASVRAGAKRLQYRDYVHLRARELSFGKMKHEENRQSVEQYINGGVSSQHYDRKALEWLMDAKTAAVAAAPGAKGNFPLVLYGPGSGGNAFENSILCEYLASHGYVVAAIPSIGTYSRAPNVDLLGFNSYARDMEFAIAAMRTFPNTDAKNVAIAGFSMGGSSGTLLQMRNMNIRGAVYFDTGLPYREFLATHLKNAAEWDTSALRAPQLYFVRRVPQVDPEFAKDIQYAETFTLFSGKDFFRHNDYIADGMLAGVVPGLFPENASDRKALYESVCRYTLNFLNGFLKSDSIGIEFLKKKPEQNGVPPKVLEFNYKPAAAPPPRRWEILEMLETDGAPKFRKAYAEYRRVHPNSGPITENDFIGIGFLMLSREDAAGAIEMFEMSVEMYPASATGRFSLSEAYETAGSIEESLFNAKSALELLAADTVINEQARNAMRQMLEARISRLNK